VIYQILSAARLSDHVSGRVLEISTNQPGIQFYNGSFLDGSVTGRTGRNYGPRVGICLEPQNFPDAPNHPSFPSCCLVPDQTYANRLGYRFGGSSECDPAL
jgi:aldose 1-epimerase